MWSNGEVVVQAATGTTDNAGSVTGSVLPEKQVHMGGDGDIAMTEASDSAHRRDKEHERQDIVSAQSSSNAPFLPPIDSSLSPPASASPTRNASPALGVPASDDHPPASAASPAEAPADKNVPAYLNQAILAHLYGVSPASAWQDLVTAFLQFERASPPSGVSCDFFTLIYDYAHSTSLETINICSTARGRPVD